MLYCMQKGGNMKMLYGKYMTEKVETLLREYWNPEDLDKKVKDLKAFYKEIEKWQQERWDKGEVFGKIFYDEKKQYLSFGRAIRKPHSNNLEETT